jgi:DNA-binding CsgD family transcriptional regulator
MLTGRGLPAIASQELTYGLSEVAWGDVDERVIDLFHEIARNPGGSLQTWARAVGEDAAWVTSRLEVLAGLGVVHESDSQGRWRVVDPRTALSGRIEVAEASVAAHIAELNRTRQLVSSLFAGYVQRSAFLGEEIEVLADRNQVLSALSTIVAEVRDEVASFVTVRVDPSMATAGRALDAALVDRGVSLRTVTLDGILRDAGMRRDFRASIEMGSQVRSVPRLPSRMLIFDRAVAVIPQDPEDPRGPALLIRNAATVRLLFELFERTWECASDIEPPSPAPHESDPRVSALELEILQALSSGQKDDAIARATGQSVRTVRRMISALSERVNARGRFELGMLAVELGWLDVPARHPRR